MSISDSRSKYIAASSNVPKLFTLSRSHPSNYFIKLYYISLNSSDRLLVFSGYEHFGIFALFQLHAA